MPLVEWSDEKLSVKVSMIDRQHKKMVGMINELYDSVEAKKEKGLLAELLIKLVHYTNYHFATEEKYFKQHNYPEMTIHKAQHDQLREQVAVLDERYYTGDKMITSEVMKLLNDWLFDHIIGSDRKFGQFLNEKGTF
jgi:hemerythrin